MTDKQNETAYSAPVVRELGSVEQMTEKLNKIGSASDKFTAATGIVGDIVKLP